MKQLMTVWVLLAIALTASGQEAKVNVATPGTLAEQLTASVPVEQLTVTGTLNNSDLKTIRGMKSLKVLNLGKLKNKQLGDSAFYGMTTLEKAVLPKKLRRLGKSAFEGCLQLRSVEFSNYMEFIPDQMLKDCPRIDKINIYNSRIESIGKSAFMNSGVRIIPLPQELRTIGIMAFANCKRLETIRIPKWVNEIGALAFANCTLLRTILVRSETPPVCAIDAFQGLNDCLLTVPHPELYRDRTPWNQINLDYNNYNGKELKTFDKSDLFKKDY